MKLTDLTEAAQSRPQSISALTVICFGPDKFKNPASEETLVLHFCSEKHLFESLAAFTITSVCAFEEASGLDQDTCLPLIVEAEVRAITRDELDRITRPLLMGLAQPVELALQGPLVQAVQLFNDWDFVALVGETDNQYFGFYWETTA
jgi:hypothetical protein